MHGSFECGEIRPLPYFSKFHILCEMSCCAETRGRHCCDIEE